MIRLALLGSNISHSLSPAIYSVLLPKSKYDLIDVSIENCPSLEELSLKYDAINITTPFKKSFSTIDPSFDSINTICFKEKKLYVENTDLIALNHLIEQYLISHSKFSIIILGDGVMSDNLQYILKNKKISYQVLARSKGDDLNQLSLNKSEQVMVVNATSRDFIYEGSSHNDWIFWDLNYNHPHEQTLPKKFKLYYSGRELLYLQALSAVKFWAKYHRIQHN